MGKHWGGSLEGECKLLACLGRATHLSDYVGAPTLHDLRKPPSMMPFTCNACVLTGGTGILRGKQHTCICSLVQACGRLSCQAKGRDEDSESGGKGLGSKLAA